MEGFGRILGRFLGIFHKKKLSWVRNEVIVSLALYHILELHLCDATGLVVFIFFDRFFVTN